MKRLHVACVAAFLSAAPGTASAQWISVQPGPTTAPAAATAPESTTTAYAPPPYPYAAPYGAYAYGAPPPPLAFSPSELSPDDDGPVAPKSSRRTGSRLTTAGVVLTLAGATAAAIGGGILGATADSGGGGHDSLGYREAGRQLGVALGGTLLAVGGACVLVGIPLWATGASRSSSSSP